MPPGHTRSRPPAKVIEKATAQACLVLARQVQKTQGLAGNPVAAEGARQVALLIESQLLLGLK